MQTVLYYHKIIPVFIINSSSNLEWLELLTIDKRVLHAMKRDILKSSDLVNKDLINESNLLKEDRSGYAATSTVNRTD